MPRQARLDAPGILSSCYCQRHIKVADLNPLRARLVKDISELDRYRWCGHGVIMGRIKHEWQDRDYVLSWFGE